MPTKRLSPSSDLGDAAELPLKRTHRTHEENQERAYIAASRRADRDIEHRIRSALKASECRKKRTGRGLKITREAVMGDEQYESEEDDHTARRFSMPAATSSSAIPNPYNMQSRADRYAEIDALFAKHFPHVQLSSSRYGSQVHRHSYPQSLPLQTAFLPRYSHDAAAPPPVQASPILTPPTSYPLLPAREQKSRSMSPLALGGSNRSPESSASNMTPQTANLGIPLADSGAGTGYLLDDGFDAQGGYLYDSSRTATAPSAPMVPPVDFSAAVAPDSSWYGGESLPPAGGGWHHGRNLSISSALEQFQFEPMPVTTGAETASLVAEPTTLIDPAILPPVAPTSVSGEGTRAVTATPPNEPWADWVNLDGDAPQPLGVKV